MNSFLVQNLTKLYWYSLWRQGRLDVVFVGELCRNDSTTELVFEIALQLSLPMAIVLEGSPVHHK